MLLVQVPAFRAMQKAETYLWAHVLEKRKRKKRKRAVVLVSKTRIYTLAAVLQRANCLIRLVNTKKQIKMLRRIYSSLLINSL